MAQLDRILERYDLKTLEDAFARRRSREKRKLDRLIAKQRKLEEQLRKLAAVTAAATGRPQRTIVVGGTNARSMNDITLAEVIEQVLKARGGKPAHSKDLTATIVKRNLYRTKSKNLLTTVRMTLWRDKRFKKVKPGLYALRKAA